MTQPVKVDPGILQYATEKQRVLLEALIECGSTRRAAEKTGTHFSYIARTLRAVSKRAAMSGYAPDGDMTHQAPSPFVVKGVSTYYDRDGEKRGQWVKTKLDDDLAMEAVQEWIESLAEDARGLSPLVLAPEFTDADLLVAYLFGDPHIGMYAWAAEAGEDFDLGIAESTMCAAMDRLIASSPKAETAIIDILGDTFHANDQSNVTPGHKHQLDVDSRYPKVMQVGIRAIRYLILRALEKHFKVIVRVEPGNHDPQAKWALTFALAAYFENDPRVIIDLSPSKFWYYQFGKVLIGSTHGDTVKHDRLPGVMAADRPEAWGTTKHRYWYTGHVHNKAVTEYPGVICESFRTLAPADAYAAGHAYRSGRDLQCIVHHKEHGEVERHRCDVGMLA